MNIFKQEKQFEEHSCDQCNFKSHIKLIVFEHCKNKHALGLDNHEQEEGFHSHYQCRNCEFTTNSLLLWIRHQCRTTAVFQYCEPHLLDEQEMETEASEQFCIEGAITVYACLKCPYKSKRKQDLLLHETLQHAPPEEIEYANWFRCSYCSYHAKQKRTLRKHLLEHTAPDQIVWFSCASCPYTSKQKSHLKQHMLTHVVPESIDWFNCTKCTYRSKYKAGLKRHELLKHVLVVASETVAPAAVETIKEVKSERKEDDAKENSLDCSHCSYRAMKASHLREHMLKHAAPEDIKWFCCPQCTYRGKQKKHLKQHMMQHAGYEEIKWFDCNQCSYQTKYKSHLTLHMVQHAPPEEIVWYRCQQCPFRTKRDRSLTCHVMTQHIQSASQGK